MRNLSMEKVLKTYVPNYDMTVQQFLTKCLVALWDEDEGFDGKRPLGNSDWKIDLMEALAQKDTLTDQEKEDADRLIRAAIKYMCI